MLRAQYLSYCPGREEAQGQDTGEHDVDALGR